MDRQPRLLHGNQLDRLEVDERAAAERLARPECQVRGACGKGTFADAGLAIVVPGPGAGRLAAQIRGAGFEDKALARGLVLTGPVQPDGVAPGLRRLDGPGRPVVV